MQIHKKALGGGSNAMRRSPIRGPLPPQVNAFPCCGGAGVRGSGGEGPAGAEGNPTLDV